MFRSLIAVAVLITMVAVAQAQPRRELPLSPGVRPASPFGPGMPLPPPRPSKLSQWQHRFVPDYAPGGVGFGFGYPYYSPWWGAAPQTYIVPLPEPEPLPAPRPTAPDNIALANEFPATLTLQLPTSGDVWVKGELVPGKKKEEHVLTSPVLRSNERHTFDVKAQWTVDGKTYEATRSVTLAAGDRSRLIIVSGTEIEK